MKAMIFGEFARVLLACDGLMQEYRSLLTPRETFVSSSVHPYDDGSLMEFWTLLQLDVINSCRLCTKIKRFQNTMLRCNITVEVRVNRAMQYTCFSIKF